MGASDVVVGCVAVYLGLVACLLVGWLATPAVHPKATMGRRDFDAQRGSQPVFRRHGRNPYMVTS